MKSLKKPLLILALILDVAVTVFLFVISILILAKVIPAATINEAINNSNNMPLIKYLLQNPTIYLVAFVIPLFVLLAVNVIILFVYVKKTSKNQPAKLQDLSDEQKEALRQELLKDLSGDSKAKDESEDSEEEDEEEKTAKKKAAPKKAPAKKEEPENEEPEEDEEEKQKPTFRNYHVSKRAEDGKWTVKFAGGEKVIKLFDTQKEALEYTKKMAENQGGSVLVHNSKGANKGKIKSK